MAKQNKSSNRRKKTKNKISNTYIKQGNMRNNFCHQTYYSDQNIYRLTLRDFIFQNKYINYIYNTIF